MEDEGAPPFDGLTEDDLLEDAEVDTMVREAITASVGDNQFLHTKIDVWSNNIVEGCLKRLAALNKPFKCVGLACDGVHILVNSIFVCLRMSEQVWVQGLSLGSALEGVQVPGNVQRD